MMGGKDVEPTDATGGSDSPSHGLDPQIQLHLGQAIRTYAEDIIKLPIPAKFLDLLAQLEAEEEDSK